MIRRYVFGILLGSFICFVVGLTPADENHQVATTKPTSQPAVAVDKPAMNLPGELTDRFLPVGGKDILWLLRCNRSDFDVLTRKLGKEWQWVGRNFTPANPHCPATLGQNLHVFFEGGTHVFFDASTGMAIGPSTPGNVIAAGRAVEFLGESGPGLIIAVAQRTGDITSRPTSQPAKSAGQRKKRDSQAIVVFRFSASQWVEVARLEGVCDALAADDTDVQLAAFGDAIFLLMRQGDRSCLTRYIADKQQWRQMPDAFAFDEKKSGRLLSLQVVADRLVGLFAHEGGRFQLRTFDEKICQFTSPQTIKLDGTPARLGADVWVSSMAGRLVLRWRRPGDDKVNLATCSLTGEMSSVEDIRRSIGEMPDTDQARRLREYVVLGIVVVFIVIAFAARPRNTAAMFMLPPTLKPGNLIKRLLAFLLDFVPFFILGMAVFVPERLKKLPDEIRQMMENPEQVETIEHLYAQLLMLGLYIAYCTVMEMRFGATVGKMALRLRVVEADGNKPGLRSAVLRNITKAIELPILAGHEIWFSVILFMLPVITRNRQRLGDMVARTAIVDSRKLPAPPTEQPDDKPIDKQKDNNP